jgi:hypothetical protein
VKIVRATPSEVRFDFDRPLVRSVPVTPRFEGEGRNGYQVTAVGIDPPSVEIVGPRKRVLAVQSVLTDPIPAGSGTGFERVKVNTYVMDPFVRIRSTPQVTASFTMRK